MSERLLNSDPDFRAFMGVSGEPIDLRGLYIISELRPIECHIKPDGSKSNGPSLCFVLRDHQGGHFYAQISVEMLKPILEAL